VSDPTSTKHGTVVLDDGDYSVELHPGYPEATAPALLRRRCHHGVTTPDGFAYIGRVDLTSEGLWRANLTQKDDPSTDSDTFEVGNYKGRVFAIIAMWRTRELAHSGQSEE
jgi:hypothetical protein